MHRLSAIVGAGHTLNVSVVMLTTLIDCCNVDNMERKAKPLVKERVKLSDDAFAEIRIVQVPEPVRGSTHLYKYGLVYVVAGQCVLRYDNEAGKGDHKHIGSQEVAYGFTTLDQLIDDFWADIAQL